MKVLTSQQAAEDEVLRLNHINPDNSCKYFWCTSRLIEQSAEVPKLIVRNTTLSADNCNVRKSHNRFVV